MKKIQPASVIVLGLLLLNACSSISEGLGGSKKKGSDEFLVEKKAPLVVPPSYGELPQPTADKSEKSTLENKFDIKKILNQSSLEDKENNEKNSTIEESIIKKINKKKIISENVDQPTESIIEPSKKKSLFKKLKEKFKKDDDI
tara:strand:+ start:926 stop:1357 length:432 start_codon:yes stop_codon:yes gene_type:complete